MTKKILMAGAGFAALAAAAPLSAQYGYYPPYGGNYGAPYGNAYGYYSHANAQQFAVNQCTAAVNNRLHARTGVAGLIGSLVGAQTSGRVLTITQVRPRSATIRVRGLASSGRMAYNPYGYGYYGAVGAQYAQAADLSFKCDVGYNGRIRDIDINRR